MFILSMKYGLYRSERKVLIPLPNPEPKKISVCSTQGVTSAVTYRKFCYVHASTTFFFLLIRNVFLMSFFYILYYCL